MQAKLAILIPTLGRSRLLRRVLDRLDRQTTDLTSFEVIVVADAREGDLAALDDATARRPYRIRRLQAAQTGASAARNVAWRAATAPLLLFLDDDILPERGLVAQHLEWHRQHAGSDVGVLGRVRWADELSVTPFMRWLENGIQFDYPNIEGIDAGWGRFYTANASVKRALVAEVGGFDESALPFGHEDLDLALRMHRRGFRLLYNRAAVAEHIHAMDLEFWKRRVARIAVSERRFCQKHPEVSPYFLKLFACAASSPPAKGRAARFARVVPRSTPMLGPRVWSSADAVYKQILAEPFLAAWQADEARSKVAAGPTVVN